MLMMRIMAQFVDLVVGVLALLVTFIYMLPFLSGYLGNDMLLALIGIGMVILIVFTLQYPFMVNQQTLGKAFFSLRIVSTETTREKVTVGIVIQREILCKLLSCYLICLPVFFGKAGGQEEATRTAVVKSKRIAGVTGCD